VSSEPSSSIFSAADTFTAMRPSEHGHVRSGSLAACLVPAFEVGLTPKSGHRAAACWAYHVRFRPFLRASARHERQSG